MASSVFPRSYTQVIAANGRKAAGAKIYFYEAGTTTPRPVYSDDDLSTPHAHPVVCDANGIIPAIFLAYGSYRVRVTTSADVVISDIDNVANPAPPDSGGGGGIVVAADEIFQTGFPIWLPRTGSLDGFVIMNGLTIGSASSGATGRANADTAALYAWYWNNVDDAYAAVTGGRGASASADFAANKPLATIDMRGRAPFGLDDMGRGAASAAQAVTTINTTNGSPNITVAGNGGIVIGMYVVAAGIPTGTRVASISGATVVLENNATATAGGLTTPARFSMFLDAQEPGATGGSNTHRLRQLEMPVDIGSATTTINNGTTVLRGGQAVSAGTGFFAATQISDITASTTITNPLGDYAHNNVPLAALGTWYQKL